MRNSFLLLFFCLNLLLPAGNVPEKKSSWELTLGGGVWTLGPLTSMFEKLAVELAETAAADQVRPYLLPFQNLLQETNADLSSKGHFFQVALRYRFPGGRWSAGVELMMFSFHLPLKLNMNHYISLGSIRLVAAHTQGDGVIEIQTIAPAFLAGWRAYEGRRFSIDLEAGILFTPLSGNLSLKLDNVVDYFGSEFAFPVYVNESLASLRNEIAGMPALLVSPLIRVSTCMTLLPRLGLYLDGAFCQGLAVSGGLRFFLSAAR